MTTGLVSKNVNAKRKAQQEYNLTLDGVVALPTTVAEKAFFDGLLDVVIAHVEKYEGQMAVSMKHKLYEAEEGFESKGSEVKRVRQNSKNGQGVHPTGKKVGQSRQRARG